MNKNRKKGIFSNVGYYAVLMATLWTGNAMADVVMVNSVSDWSYGYQGYKATCPAGYVITGVIGEGPLPGLPHITSTTIISTGSPNGEAADVPGAQFKLICAKVCN